MAISFKGLHFPKDVTLFAVFFTSATGYRIATLRKFSSNAA